MNPDDQAPVVALMGNPNVGKSTLFNSLTGMHQHTGNWPGKTVAMAKGHYDYQGKRYVLVDLPGTYSLSAHSPEEEIAGAFLRSGQISAVVVVCDATALEKCLPLVLQIRQITGKVAVFLNLQDVAEKRGIHVDQLLLSQRLAVPVVSASARKKKTLLPLLDQISRITDAGESNIPNIYPQYDAETLASSVREIAEAAITYSRPDPDRMDRRLDALLTSRWLGYPVMLFLLAAVFWITIQGANAPSEHLSHLLFGLGDRIYSLLERIGCPVPVRDALILGVYRMTAWVVSVMLPPMAIFFPLFTLLEDAGYLPRVAFNLDRPFQRCQACGKQALTMAMGFGCNAAGVVGCRIIDSPRERLLAILTNSFVPCNGRFPVLILLIGLFFPGKPWRTALGMTLLVLLGIAVTFLMTKALSVTFLKGESSSYVLELPPYRKPKVLQVLIRSVMDRTLFVLGRAVSAAAPAGLLLWALAAIQLHGRPLLQFISGALEPIGYLLGMDGVILLAFILGFPANETVIPIALMIYLSRTSLGSGMSSAEIRPILLDNGWSWTTAVSVMLFTLMHWPCSTTLLTIRKETGSRKWTLLAALLPTACGIIICFLFTLILRVISAI